MKSNKLLSVVMAICLFVGFAFAADYIIRECFFSQGNENIDINETVDFPADDVNKMSVDLIKADLIIKSGEKLSLSTDSGYITYSLKKSKLTVGEKTHSLKNAGGTVILTIPKDKRFSDFDINTGAGNITADEISSLSFDLDYGAGNIEINKLRIESEAKIDGGAGKIVIHDGKLNNTDINVGVGNITVTAMMTGNTDIECGVGKADLTLLGGEDLYSFDVDKGVGSVTINGENVGDGKYGYGGNHIDLDGGVGSIIVSFE